MNNLHFSQDQLVQVAKLSDADIAVIDECRGEQNKLGLGYQLGFVRLFNQFPAQVTFEPIEDLVAYMSIMATIIYWQAKEISRIVKEYNPEEAGIDISLLAHISPIEWSNVVLYGEYKLNRDLVRR